MLMLRAVLTAEALRQLRDQEGLFHAMRAVDKRMWKSTCSCGRGVRIELRMSLKMTVLAAELLSPWSPSIAARDRWWMGHGFTGCMLTLFRTR